MERESRFDSLKRQRRSPGPGFGSAMPREICQPVDQPPSTPRPASSSAPPPSDGHRSGACAAGAGAGMSQSMTAPGESGASGAALLSNMASCMTGSVGPALYCGGYGSGYGVPLTRSITSYGPESDDEQLQASVSKRRALSAAGAGRRPLSRPPSEQRASASASGSGSGGESGATGAGAAGAAGAASSRTAGRASASASATGRSASPGSYLSHSMVEYTDSEPEHRCRSLAPALNRTGTGDAHALFTYSKRALHRRYRL